MTPVLVRRLIYPAHEWLRRRSTFADLRRLERSQWLPPEALRRLQGAKLQDLLSHARACCPYYREVFDRAGLDPTTDDPWDALQRLPLLDKGTIREHLNEMTWPSAPGGVHESVTGGSTGEPLRFRFDRRRQALDKAARMRSHRWFNVEVGDRELYLWGSPLEAAAQDRLKSWRDRLTNELLLSAFDLSPERMDEYLEIISRFDPACIFGYPSSLLLLCQHGRRRGRVVRPASLRMVSATGELLDQGQRREIAGYFAVPVADGYGSREAGYIAHECPRGYMHVTDESVVVEFIDDAGRPVADGRCGEIVVTQLDAYAMPLIRYRTGDMGRRVVGRCPCGRGLSLMEVVGGRRTDHLVATDGRMMHGLSMIYILREMEGVKRFQIRQGAGGNVEVRVIPQGTFTDADRCHIVEQVQARLGQDVEVAVKLADSIEAGPSGKFRYVTSEAARHGVAV
jgi:phenylacetate-CoA ligase